ncbi:hypothetical protein DMX85_12235 [Cutibacterium acnes]|uniref:hypothetical protein n=1 Tax=Cutibacterium acnes TaxID=1747 RepID=UPI0010FD8325|nr:hypothetical protein [Cutibacterium acnes]MCY0870806.1 hypothetical protein [Bacillota bacterium]TLG53170.1 hypothetical protein FD538_12190 [Cutibacterium acnes]TMT70218.1 hypothetical protein DMX85_12235 [Cutibacterium acnes]
MTFLISLLAKTLLAGGGIGAIASVIGTRTAFKNHNGKQTQALTWIFACIIIILVGLFLLHYAR